MKSKPLLQALFIVVFTIFLSNNGSSQSAVTTVDEFSKVPCYVEIFYNKKVLRNAT